MEKRGCLYFCLFIVLVSAIYVNCEYHTESSHHDHTKEKVTNLHFYLNDILSGKNPTAVMVAHPYNTNPDKSNPTPFGSVFAIDDKLTDGLERNSKVIGNAQGLYVSSARDLLSLVMYVDFAFTSGKFNGSSISVFSRNPVMDGDGRELAVVGGRGKFRMAKGFAELTTRYLNVTNGDAVIEYNVTVYHY
ncbi:Dirigent protein 4 [Ranunculus cassubicifolius]